jgi:RNA polymerase sigma factor (sigma-70 family)
MPTARVLDALQVLVPPPDDGDGECLRRFLAGRDEAAFAELVRRHGPMVYGACRRILANGPEADDAFQAAFFVLARKADTIRGNVRSWLYGVAVRVAHKARVQAVRRRVRQMAAAKPEAVLSPVDDRDLWAVLDEELAKLPDELRQAVLACDVNGLSRSKAAAELGWPEGTVAKRLTKAREELARRLTRRGISLGAGALALSLGERAAAAVPGALLAETARQAASFALGGHCSQAARTLAESVLRSLSMGVAKVWMMVGLLVLSLAGGSLMLAGAPGEPTGAPPAAASKSDAAPAGAIWKERYQIENQGKLPTSVAYSADGQTLLAGFADSEVMSLIFDADDAKWKWKETVVEAVPAAAYAVAYSADGKKVYATTRDGVRVIDAASGKQETVIEAKGSNPTALGVFPNKAIAPDYTQSKIVFGNASGYFVKSWAEGKLPDSIGTIETNTGTKPTDAAAVPLAVDPKGRSAILTGPIDAKSNRNVLWAYVCGDYEKGSPGNRVMPGHEAVVVSAAWAKDGATAVTGDASGRVIVWDAKTMKEIRRVELGGRVGALAITDDGARTAAYVLGKTGEVFVWDTAKPTNAMKPIHTDVHELTGKTSFASLSFTPDGKRLAGCAANLGWLSGRGGQPVGKVRVWELAGEPKAQRPPKPLFTKELPKGATPSFAVYSRHSLLMKATGKEGAIDFRDLRDGSIQQRLTLGQFSIGRMKISPDRQWLALETHSLNPNLPAKTFDLYLLDLSKMIDHKTIPTCDRLLDVGSGHVAVVRNGAIELWDLATAKLKKTAPFNTKRIDAAALSPDGSTLAVSDWNDLVLWRWTENAHERIDLGHTVGSLAFSPDGKTLAEGPSPRDAVRLRDVGTRKVERSLFNGTKQSLDVPKMAFTQGGRLLVAANAIHLAKEIPVPHRIHFWDTLTGGVAHEIAILDGFPRYLDVSPDGRTLIAAIEHDGGVRLAAWAIDGEGPAAPPAAWREGKTIPSPNNGPVTGLAMSPDGKMLAVVANEQVAILDPASGTRLDKGRIANMKVLPKHHGLAFSSRGKLAVTGAAGVNAFEDLLAEIPPRTHGTTDSVAGFQPHQVVWIDDNFQNGTGRLIATDGHEYREFGWAAKTVNGVEIVEKTIGERWTAQGAHTHEPTALAATPTRIVHSGADADETALQLRFTERQPHNVRTLAGHGARPTAAVIAPDGNAIVSGDDQGTIILWTGDAFRAEVGVYNDKIGPAKVVPIGASETYRESRRWTLGGSIAALALAPDQRTVAALRRVVNKLDALAEVQFELFVFDLRETGDIKPIWRSPQGFPGQYTLGASLAFHPNGTKLYGAFGDPYLSTNNRPFGRSSGIRVWEKAAARPATPAVAAPLPPPAKLTWKAEEPIADPQFDIQSLAISKDGSKFAICSNGETLVYDAATRKKLYSASGCFPQFVKTSLFTWALFVTEYDAGTGKLIKQYPEAKTEFGWQIAALSPDGKAAAGFDGSQIQLRDVANGFEPVRLTGQGRPSGGTTFGMLGHGVAWSPDGARVAGFHAAAERGGAGGLAVWNVKTGEILARHESNVFEFRSQNSRFAFAPDGKSIAVGGLSGDNEKNSSLTILDATTLKNARGSAPVRSRDGGADVTAVAYSPDGNTIAIGVKLHTGKGPLNRVQLYDAKTLELGVSLLPPHDTAPITSLAFAPDGRTLMGTTGEGPFSEPQKKETLHRVLIWRGEPAK